MNARLQTLEAKVQTLQHAGIGSTVDTNPGARKPALTWGAEGTTRPRRVRQANIAMGTHAMTKYLWLQLSQSPERRRRVQLAGKCNCLSLGATLAQVETE